MPDNSYKYYILGNATPIRVTLHSSGVELGAEVPDAQSRKLVVKNVLLSRLKQSPETEEVDQAHFDAVCASVYKTNSPPGM